ncbi:NADP-binding protein [Dacryopinax primogenitus]|uniref:NADP-binding protein n=1 Tax=Dacryopinax primogenitus (strain DJM 731) TaxID=1858805 RepID=M5GA37_DACPD|nr:NADP-binding protein [Dacryopinax primogenitus]EJU00718.1 NADP-binding protein [Dacryopinax primogenitus]
MSTTANAPKHPPPKHATIDESVTVPYPGDKLDIPGHETRHDQGSRTHRTLKSFSMEGKVCVVTGAARGLGNMFARTFVESGCSKVAIIDLRQEDADKAAAQLVSDFESQGQVEKGEIECIGLGCDVANEAAVQAAFNTIVQKFGAVHAVVANAGIVENYPALEYPAERMRKLFDINVHGVFFCAREAAKHMIEKNIQGSIVLIASMSANIVNYPQPQMPYNSSKAAVKHMAASLAVEWAQKGVRVNSLSPGYMLTALTKAVVAPHVGMLESWAEKTPMGRVGDPEDLKGAIVYLASDASKFTTGSELVVDGGYSII